MKFVIVFSLLFFSHISYSKESLPDDCIHLKSVGKANFVLLNKKEFIQLGECLAIHFIKKHSELDLVRSCNEVDEDRRNLLGILSLSKLEAILIGQCVGAIKYIYQHYNNEPINNSSNRWQSTYVYRCIKGKKAVDKIRYSSKKLLNRTNLLKLLCYMK
ncbi:hypothetical protein GCM10008107_05180 [Psychrosphaera saromensis]|uniref:Uncharacterized protein n=1 Tax=Psychrosphaera saromensis TaxID=716813 RepID=A0A2S7UZ53_9GAMM|nr:hypothetical protein [Psychrosphaera saromensis]PQJ54550.1 hypothetical protein BTO11_13435 [Psychrosphaera saromensis]GHB59019.1 hypothetical protein GCM10008107_05180 [Psychrosphaera saromensis]GLQ14239.1 hypothetical protein GCM10007917_16940 [Psychrosphaera saromensis]